MSERRYAPLEPARRPGGRPPQRPRFRVLVHHQFEAHYEQMVARVGVNAAQRLWDHLAYQPEKPPPTAGSTFLRGPAGRPREQGFSRTVHYELSSMARVDYQWHPAFRVDDQRDAHPVTAILTINYSSH